MEKIKMLKGSDQMSYCIFLLRNNLNIYKWVYVCV